MNSLDFEVLKQRIALRLHEKGAATSETIAYELQAPLGNVCFALEKLEGERETPIRRLAFGLWDLIDEAEKIA
jgi:hypothetical protein